MKDRL
jgi:hypothetical protein